MVAVIRLGQPVPSDRFADKSTRTRTMLRETLGHTRMFKWSVVGAAHWFVMVGFIFLSVLVVSAYLEVVDPHLALPLVGEWTVYGLVTEALSVVGIVAIVT